MMDIDFNFDDDKIKKSLNELSDAISNFKKNH